MSNRENVRDEWFALLRDAAACAQPFAQGGAPMPHALGAGKPPWGVLLVTPCRHAQVFAGKDTA